MTTSKESKVLPREFYTRNDVVMIASELLGMVVYTRLGNELCAGVICETEAYAGVIDKASHAYNNRCTARTEIMFREGGCAYVYLCYGIHSLFNIVTSVEDTPHAVLIRGIRPLSGVEIMLERIGKAALTAKSGFGPGKVSKLLGIKLAHTGLVLCGDSNDEEGIWIQDEGLRDSASEIKSGPRIGVNYAGEDALLPYRFWI